MNVNLLWFGAGFVTMATPVVAYFGKRFFERRGQTERLEHIRQLLGINASLNEQGLSPGDLSALEESLAAGDNGIITEQEKTEILYGLYESLAIHAGNEVIYLKALRLAVEALSARGLIPPDVDYPDGIQAKETFERVIGFLQENGRMTEVLDFYAEHVPKLSP